MELRMIDPSAFSQMEKDATNVLIKIFIPLWIILSVTVTIWGYKSARAKVFLKVLYRSVFPPRESKGEKKLGLEDRFITVLNQE
jgi:hypothetical protein